MSRDNGVASTLKEVCRYATLKEDHAIITILAEASFLSPTVYEADACISLFSSRRGFQTPSPNYKNTR